MLARDRMAEKKLDSLWRAEVVDRQVKAALDDLLDPENTGPLERILQKRTTGVSPSDMRASLRRARFDISFPSPSDGATSMAAEPAPETKPARKAPKPTLRLATSARRRTTQNVSVGDLISVGLLRPPVELVATYRGVEVRAWIKPDGQTTRRSDPRERDPTTPTQIAA